MTVLAIVSIVDVEQNQMLVRSTARPPALRTVLTWGYVPLAALATPYPRLEKSAVLPLDHSRLETSAAAGSYSKAALATEKSSVSSTTSPSRSTMVRCALRATLGS